RYQHTTGFEWPYAYNHEAAHRWFSTTGSTSWATCALTENGFVRIASHPRYPNRPGDAPTVLNLLRQFCALEGHHFWPEDISLRNLPLLPNTDITHNNITDIYPSHPTV